jgi:hypothetical protein
VKLEFAATSTPKLAKLSAFALVVTAIQGCSMLSPASNVVETQTVTIEQQMAQHLAEWETVKPDIDRMLKLESKIVQLEEDLAILTVEKAEKDKMHKASMPGTASSTRLAADVVATTMSKDDEMDAEKIMAKAAPLRENAVVAKMNKLDAEDMMMTDLEMSLMEEAQAEEALARRNKMTDTGPNDNYVRAEFIKKQANSTRKKTPGEYGLQLVSHRSESGANKAWTPISSKFRTLLAGKEPVIEMATVKGKQYYRLKVGPYYDKKIAVDTCKQLVLSHQDCLVSDYYGEPF